MKKLEDYNLFEPETLKCPYEFYARLREEAPVYTLPGTGMTLVTGYDLIRGALRDTRVWSSSVASAISPAGLTEANDDINKQIQAILATDVELEQTLLSVDPPDHAKHRTRGKAQPAGGIDQHFHQLAPPSELAGPGLKTGSGSSPWAKSPKRTNLRTAMVLVKFTSA